MKIQTPDIKPIKGSAILLEPPRTGKIVAGVALPDSCIWTLQLDFTVAVPPPGDPGYGPGDRVLLQFAEAGRKVSLHGVTYRIVKETDIIGVLDE